MHDLMMVVMGGGGRPFLMSPPAQLRSPQKSLIRVLVHSFGAEEQG